jgi:hypothetical protein
LKLSSGGEVDRSSCSEFLQNKANVDLGTPVSSRSGPARSAGTPEATSSVEGRRQLTRKAHRRRATGSPRQRQRVVRIPGERLVSMTRLPRLTFAGDVHPGLRRGSAGDTDPVRSRNPKSLAPREPCRAILCARLRGLRCTRAPTGAGRRLACAIRGLAPEALSAVSSRRSPLTTLRGRRGIDRLAPAAWTSANAALSVWREDGRSGQQVARTHAAFEATRTARPRPGCADPGFAPARLDHRSTTPTRRCVKGATLSASMT